MPTLSDIRSNLMFHCGTSDVAGTERNMFNAAVNRAYRRVLVMTKQDETRRTFSFSTVASQSQYGLPLYVRTILDLHDVTNARSVSEISATRFDKSYSGTTGTDTPLSYYVVGRYGCQTQPAATGVATVVSSSTADVTNFYVRITGFNASDVEISEKLTLNGTTTVTGTNSYVLSTGIEQIVKSAGSGYSFTGNITVARSVTLAVIPVWVTSPSYLWIEMYPTPSAVASYTGRCIGYTPDLVNDDDYPQLDEAFHDLVTWLAGKEVLPTYGKMEQATNFSIMADRRIKEIQTQGLRRTNKVQTFADVSIGSSLPNRPLIRGVDIGLAT